MQQCITIYFIFI